MTANGVTAMQGPVVVVGPPGSGKSTVGRLLAERLGVAFRDADADIEADEGRAISDIFAEDGEPVFREIEERTIARTLAEHDGVYALGGGAVLAEGTRRRLAGHTVVFLSVGMAEGVRRTGLSSARPLLTGVNPRATYKALLDERLPVYRGVATCEVDTDDRAPDDIVAEVIERLDPDSGAPAHTATRRTW
ncbi:shikimate kinase [Prauserella aidingensis]|uniref:shikimate kinase n=1 Tax=Prauserella aidingensis TaxID=387890 RepID=UPI0020A3A417|nr:shikimate kinase [Prauserella aidingensis]MCP2253970.1 shikimate kinase [Prauserella aidingensis]